MAVRSPFLGVGVFSRGSACLSGCACFPAADEVRRGLTLLAMTCSLRELHVLPIACRSTISVPFCSLDGAAAQFPPPPDDAGLALVARLLTIEPRRLALPARDAEGVAYVARHPLPARHAVSMALSVKDRAHLLLRIACATLPAIASPSPRHPQRHLSRMCSSGAAQQSRCCAAERVKLAARESPPRSPVGLPERPTLFRWYECNRGWAALSGTRRLRRCRTPAQLDGSAPLCSLITACTSRA